MYPGTIVNWYDQSIIDTGEQITELDHKPLLMVVSSFDKGPEKLMEVSGTNFNKLFGTMSFAKHGQNSIQAQRIINAGARLLVKRVCAEDAELANTILCANVAEKDTDVQKVDPITAELIYNIIPNANIELPASDVNADLTNPVYVVTQKADANGDPLFHPLAGATLMVPITDANADAASPALNSSQKVDTASGELVYYAISNPSLEVVASDPDADLANPVYEQLKDTNGNLLYNVLAGVTTIEVPASNPCADTANPVNVNIQKVDGNGELIYMIKPNAKLEVIASDPNADLNAPVYEKQTTITWTASSASGCKTFEDVKSAAMGMFDANNGVYPIMVIADNGRGVSGKSIRIIPDYATSRGIGRMFYTLATFEGTNCIESVNITVDPEVIYNNKSYGLQDNSDVIQVKGETLEAPFAAYITKIADVLMLPEDQVRNYDIIYGYTFRGSSLNGITLDPASIDLNATYGINLSNGSNGAFGDYPVNTPAWTEAIRKVYAGEVTDEVWDVDQHKIAAICDANFPIEIKTAIAEFVTFREDCMFFRDCGTNNTTFIQIKNYIEQNFKINNRFIADYCTYYTVKDPNTKKNITVTMMYDFVECLVYHFAKGAHNPLAGSINGFVLKEALKGSINYTPIITPTVNAKQAMDDLRVNYAIFQGDDCVVQTLYTSQKNIWSQLSYANNVLAIQEVVRAVRVACPKHRYSLVTGYDMTSYAKAVQNVLNNFNSNFDVLKFEYTKDLLKASQKIFYASIKFAFHLWAQTEIFDLFAINNEE